MKTKIRAIFCCALLLAAFAANVAAQTVEAKQTKPVIMILGSYHMGNPGRDVNNVKADDVRAEKRQREIVEIVNLLKQFKPTKIAVEVSPEKVDYLKSYQSYLDGKHELRADEIDQIAFRMGRELGHKQLYPIDWRGNFDFNKLLASAKANKQDQIAADLTAAGKAKTAEIQTVMKTASVTEIFRLMNSPKMLDEMHQPYLTFVRIGAGTDFAGADLTRDWYERNLKIYANIARLADALNERILVLIGAGHAKLLGDFVKQSGEFEFAAPNDYLK